jgi:hypothetical protein
MKRFPSRRRMSRLPSTPRTVGWNHHLARFINHIPPGLSNSSDRTVSRIVDDPAVSDGGAKTDEALEKFLRAPFQKQVARHPGILFPWRHSQEPLPRFVPGTPEFNEQGLLLGGNLDTSNPRLDAMATAKIFLGIPWYQMVFYEQWKADLAESMTWAFLQGTAALLSNVYHRTCLELSP